MSRSLVAMLRPEYHEPFGWLRVGDVVSLDVATAERLIALGVAEAMPDDFRLLAFQKQKQQRHAYQVIARVPTVWTPLSVIPEPVRQVAATIKVDSGLFNCKPRTWVHGQGATRGYSWGYLVGRHPGYTRTAVVVGQG